jgi:hypothetical protein
MRPLASKPRPHEATLRKARSRAKARARKAVDWVGRPQRVGLQARSLLPIQCCHAPAVRGVDPEAWVMDVYCSAKFDLLAIVAGVFCGFNKLTRLF